MVWMLRAVIMSTSPVSRGSTSPGQVRTAVDVKGCDVNVKGCDVDVKGYDVDVKGYDVDVKGCDVDVKGCNVDVKGYAYVNLPGEPRVHPNYLD
eukprot:2618257-Pyramimonas_sp.AAC.1